MFANMWRRATLLSSMVTIVALYRTIFVFLMFFVGAVHTNRYTYWNYIGATAFYVILWISYIRNDAYLFKTLCVWFVPIVFGSVFFVFLYIILILQLDNGQLFIAATYIDGGALSVGTVHTLDHIIHTFPIIDFLVVLVSGYVKEARHAVKSFHRRLASNAQRAVFLIYFFVAPLSPFALYCCFFNPFKEYPVDVSSAVPLFSGLLIYFAIMLWVHSLMTTKNYGHFKKTQLVANPQILASSVF